MSMDLTGATLADLIVQALNLPPPPTNPTPAQQAQYLDQVQKQKETWTTICNQLLTYIANNATVTTTDTVPASGIDDSTGHACTGTATGTGTGTIS